MKSKKVTKSGGLQTHPYIFCVLCGYTISFFVVFVSFVVMFAFLVAASPR
jgi:uncharacterized membrane protein